MKKEGEKIAGKEDILRVAQPSPGPGAPGSSSSLMAEAKSYGRAYWIRVIIGLLFVCFFCAWVPNAYLQWKYADVFQESPCKLCEDLNNATAPCFWGSNYSIVPETTAWTIHPIRELGFKAHWLQVPCDICGEVESGSLAMCLTNTFAPKKELNQKTNFNINLNFTEADISS